MAKAGIYCGHGKSTDGSFDPGTTYNGKTEAKMMLPITQAAVKHLRASGVTVYTDVDSGENNNINMIKQVQEANNKDVDVFVSIHCDWYKAPTGTLPLYYPGSAKGKKLAECINKHVMKDTGIGTRGLDARSDPHELRATKMTACIYECGSIKHDVDEWDTAAECEVYGKAIAKGVCEYLGVTFKSGNSSSTSKTASKPVTKPTTKKSTTEIAKEVIDGKWGNGSDRKKKLEAAGYNYSTVQIKVNELLSSKKVSSKKSTTEVAKEVIAGKWGNGETRKKKLKAAGYDYNAVQKKVNALLKG